MRYQRVTRLLGHANVEVRPVRDLSDQTRVNAYEHPEAVKERGHLITVGEVFPHATRDSRKVDADHPVPWDAWRRSPPSTASPCRAEPAQPSGGLQTTVSDGM
jgi:hypothetical protein